MGNRVTRGVSLSRRLCRLRHKEMGRQSVCLDLPTMGFPRGPFLETAVCFRTLQRYCLQLQMAGGRIRGLPSCQHLELRPKQATSGLVAKRRLGRQRG